ncbi:hypothetical protein [Bailinhaonella thermotolerans]|uniref:Lipoprotein n=1 Tax=Bailinhaonella thermotolerans TaxID=1070861 RepID=A0A3A4ATK1_9ACTN|nr:hypothetical protein [Bailinhaonella thermotolerans]RJL31939.1 hypothetical protein D5H75_15960 [Bailinhaonella thermotolerans]
MSVSRPLTLLIALTCAGALTGCQSGAGAGGGAGGGAGRAAEEPPVARGPRSPSPAPASSSAAPRSAATPASGKPSPAACPSPAEIADAVTAYDGSRGVIVSRDITCEGDWATTSMRYPGSDPARVVVRRQKGELRLVTYGTDALCEGEEMTGVPSKIRKALGDYC